jgi:hypothetical protein
VREVHQEKSRAQERSRFIRLRINSRKGFFL